MGAPKSAPGAASDERAARSSRGTATAFGTSSCTSGPSRLWPLLPVLRAALLDVDERSLHLRRRLRKSTHPILRNRRRFDRQTWAGFPVEPARVPAGTLTRCAVGVVSFSMVVSTVRTVAGPLSLSIVGHRTLGGQKPRARASFRAHCTTCPPPTGRLLRYAERTCQRPKEEAPNCRLSA